MTNGSRSKRSLLSRSKDSWPCLTLRANLLAKTYLALACRPDTGPISWVAAGSGWAKMSIDRRDQNSATETHLTNYVSCYSIKFRSLRCWLYNHFWRLLTSHRCDLDLFDAHVFGHSFAWVDDAYFASVWVRRFKYALCWLVKGEVARTLLAALSLKVHPFVLLKLRVMLLQLSLMSVFQSLNFLFLLLLNFIAVVLRLA